MESKRLRARHPPRCCGFIDMNLFRSAIELDARIDMISGCPTAREPSCSNRRSMRRRSPQRRVFLTRLASVAALGSSLPLVACGGGSEDQAAIRFVNATVDYATADFWVGDEIPMRFEIEAIRQD